MALRLKKLVNLGGGFRANGLVDGYRDGRCEPRLQRWSLRWDEGGAALSANGATIKGQSSPGRRIHRLWHGLGSATVDGNLDCSDGHFAGANNQSAIVAQSADIKGDVLLVDAIQAQGPVDLAGARLGSRLVCTHGHFANWATRPLYLDPGLP